MRINQRQIWLQWETLDSGKFGDIVHVRRIVSESGTDVNRCESRTREQESSRREGERLARDACNNVRWIPLAEKQAYSGLSRVHIPLSFERIGGRSCSKCTSVSVYDRREGRRRGGRRWWGTKETRRRTKRVERATRLFSRMLATVGVVSEAVDALLYDTWERERERENEWLVYDGFFLIWCVTGLPTIARSFGRSVGWSIGGPVCLSLRTLVRRSHGRTRNACREQKTAIPTRFKSVSPILTTVLFLSLSTPLLCWSQLSLPSTVLIPLFLACLCSCLRSSRSRSLGLGRLRGRRARENISWPSGGSAEAFSQLAVMARPAASVSAN